MELKLFSPLEPKRWLQLGFLSFFNQIPLFLFLFFLNFIIVPAKFINWSKFFPILPQIFMFLPFIFFIFLIFFSFFLYISGYSNYFYLEFLLGKRENLNFISQEHKKLAFEYFYLNLFVFLFLTIYLFFGFFILFLFKDLSYKLFLFIFIIFFIFIFALINILIKDIYLPLSFLSKKPLLENLNCLIGIVSLNSFKFFQFVLIKTFLILILASGIFFMGIISFGILFLAFLIPILGQTLLQPIIYFLNIFGLNFFQSISNLNEPILKNG